MTNKVKPIHYDKATVKELTKQVAIASVVGACKGGLFSITTGLLLRRVSTVYRNVRLPVRILYHSSWIIAGVILSAEAQLNTFQTLYFQKELKRREKVMDDAADKGVFLDEEYITKSVINDEDN